MGKEHNDMPADKPRDERETPRAAKAPIIGLIVSMLALVGLLLLVRTGPDAQQAAVDAGAGAVSTDAVAGVAVTPPPTTEPILMPTATSTPIPPPTATATAVPLPTATPLPTSTPIPPTPVPEPTSTPLPTATAVPAPTQIPTAVPQPTASPTTEVAAIAPTIVVEPTATATSTPIPPAATATATAVVVAPATTGSSLGELEAQMFAQVNRVRANAGLSPVSSNPALATIARDWSARMANQGGISHRPGDQLGAMMPSGWSAWSENVAQAGFFPGGSIAEAAEWAQRELEKSSGHYANMVGNYNSLGIGLHVQDGFVWVTQNFGRY